MLERVLTPLTKLVRVYALTGRDEYGQPQWSASPTQERRGALRRATRIEQRGEKAVMVKAYELLLDGGLLDAQSLLGAKVEVEGEPGAFLVRAVHVDGQPFLSAVTAELEDLK